MRISINILIFIIIVFISSCSNNNTLSPQPAPTNNSSKTILYDVNNPFDGTDDDYCFMLLGSDNSAQKKYFKAIMIDIVKDSMKITSGPFTLDSLIDVSTFPANIKSANSGSYLSDFVFSDSVRMRQTGLNANGKRIFTQVPWTGNGSNYVQAYANGAQIEGTTTLNYFKKPISTGTGSFEGFAIHFFFKKGTCIVYTKSSASGSTIPVSGIPEDISSVIGATYDWQNVDNYFNVTTGVGTSSHYFIDYKNWRYFRIKEFKTSVPGTAGGQHAIEYGSYKNLDNLLNWPNDWKK
ncbi:MAG TPA: hypothetical protein PK431_13180 [Chitinophagales bacterium]|nr:hypothetical protein [Chitinophagales bacterium]